MTYTPFNVFMQGVLPMIDSTGRGTFSETAVVSSKV